MLFEHSEDSLMHILGLRSSPCLSVKYLLHVSPIVGAR